MVIVLAITWLLLQIIPVTGLSGPAQNIIRQLVAIVGLVLAVLVCFGVHLPGCLTSL
jgi:hypothetical protein